MKEISFLKRQDLKEAYQKYWKPYITPYAIQDDWVSLLTPIEYNVWDEMRHWGLLFYPQYPIGKYFVDFADPINKLIVEVDGKDFHQNKEKDDIRQKEIETLGWKVFRFSGTETYKKISPAESKYSEIVCDCCDENSNSDVEDSCENCGHELNQTEIFYFLHYLVRKNLYKKRIVAFVYGS